MEGSEVRPFGRRDADSDRDYDLSRPSHEGLIRCWWAAQMSLSSEDDDDDDADDAPVLCQALYLAQLLELLLLVVLLLWLNVVEPQL